MFSFLMTVLAGVWAEAAIGDISCEMRVFTVAESGLRIEHQVPLKIDLKRGRALRLNVEVEGRYFSLTGDSLSGDFLLTQAWGKDYDQGFNATGSFNSNGRMQISQIEGSRVTKLECRKIIAGDFPNQ